MPKVKFEIVVSDARVQRALDAILRAARTRKIGDGITFVLSIDQVVRIRTKERARKPFSGRSRAILSPAEPRISPTLGF